MTLPRRTTTRIRRTAVRTALAALAAALVLLVTPAGAQAATTATITPTVSCYINNSDGSSSVLLGWTSTYSGSQTIAYGTRNVLTPSRYQGKQPTVFASGSHPGAFYVTVAASDIGYVGWTLNGTSLAYGTPVDACPAGTTLPATGNGTGIAVALLVAGGIGALTLRRVRARTAAAPTATA